MGRLKFKTLFLLISTGLSSESPQNPKDLTVMYKKRSSYKQKLQKQLEQSMLMLRKKFEKNIATLSELYYSPAIQFLLKDIVFHDLWTVLYTALLMCEPILSLLAITEMGEMLDNALAMQYPITSNDKKVYGSFYSNLFYPLTWWLTTQKKENLNDQMIANHGALASCIRSAAKTQAVHYLDNLIYELLVFGFPVPWPGSPKDLTKPVAKLFLMPQSFYERYKPHEIANAVLYRYHDTMPLLYTPIRIVENFVMMLRFAGGIWHIGKPIHYPAAILLAQYFWSDINRAFANIEDHNAQLKALEKGGTIRPFDAITGAMQNIQLINMSGTWRQEIKSLKQKILHAPPTEISDPTAVIMHRVFGRIMLIGAWYSLYHLISGEIFGLHSIPVALAKSRLAWGLGSIFGLDYMLLDNQFANWMRKNIKLFESIAITLTAPMLRNINPALAIVLTLISFSCCTETGHAGQFTEGNGNKKLNPATESICANYLTFAILSHLYQMCSLLTRTQQDVVTFKEKFRLSQLNAEIMSFEPRKDGSLPRFQPSGPSCSLTIDIPEGFEYDIPERREES